MQRLKIAAIVGILIGVAFMVFWAWLPSRVSLLAPVMDDVNFLLVFLPGFIIGAVIAFVWPRS